MKILIAGIVAAAALLFSAPAGAVNYSDSWWNPNESGWGITITDHETDLFVQWYTYDQTGHNEKFVIAGGNFTADKCTFTGSVQRVYGPAWHAPTFDPNQVVRNTVGAARLEFCNPAVPAGDMMFHYTVDGIAGAKVMTRLSFGNDAPRWGGNANTGAFAIDYTDLWWNPAESGWGVSITQHGNNMFFRIFVYDTDGRPLLFVVPGVTVNSPTSFTGAIQTTSGPYWAGQVFDPNQVVRTTVGTATLTFSDARNGTLTYTVSGQTVTKAITRMIFGHLITPNIPSTYPVGSQELVEFNALNKFRQSLGLAPLTQDSRLDQAVIAHANYNILSWKPGENAHREVAGRPGYTGYSSCDRAKAAGYPALGCEEDMAMYQPWLGYTSAVEGLIGVLLHRNSLMNPTSEDVGITNLAGVIINANKATRNRTVPADYVGVYPLPGQKNVWQTHVLESPNPFPDIPTTMTAFCANTSYPITVMSNEQTRIQVTQFAVTEDGQSTPLPARIIAPVGGNYVTGQATPSNGLPNNIATWVGKAPFKNSAKYNVTFVGSAVGAIVGGSLPINRAWSFTTAPANTPCLNGGK